MIWTDASDVLQQRLEFGQLQALGWSQQPSNWLALLQVVRTSCRLIRRNILSGYIGTAVEFLQVGRCSCGIRARSLRD